MECRHARRSTFRTLFVAVVAPMLMSACTTRSTAMTDEQLKDLATRYASAWSSQHPERLAAFYTDDGVLQVNAGAPAVGRAAVQASVAAFMTAFPDMVVVTDSVVRTPEGARFHWLWTGTNTGPGGTGHAVRMHGHEAWTIRADGRIAKSLGHYDEAEYQRQVSGGAPAGGK